ncbi:uncharacterized protein LOC142339028 [Convolutriloba macropyga]|uniref:uncharacterized protein LOC142339028 n=1 Tax=Convolutriloba macropyga TaxID=536237 RepID=UPI003F526EE2
MTLFYTLAEKMFSPAYLTTALLADSVGRLTLTTLTFIQGSNVNFERLRDDNDTSIQGFSIWSSHEMKQNDKFYLQSDFLFSPTVAIAIFTALYVLCCFALLFVVYLNPEKGKNLSKMEEEEKEMEKMREEKSSYKDEQDALFKEKPKNDYSSFDFRKLVTLSFWFEDIESTNEHACVLIAFWFLIAACLFAFMPSFFSFSTIPYSQQCFNLSVAFTSVTYVTATIIAHYTIAFNKLIYYVILLMVHYVLCIMLIFIASLSPEPPFVDSVFGQVMVIFLWSFEGATGYFLACKCCSGLGRLKMGYAVKWGTIFAQIGDIFGAIFGFILINYTDWFQEY